MRWNKIEKPIQVLTESMGNLLKITYQEYQNFLVNWSGNLMDIECGTHIRIPISAGYVSCYKSDGALKVSLWITDTLQQIKTPKDQQIN